MGTLRLKATGYEYNESDRRLKEQFINGISSEVLTAEVMKEVTTAKDTTKGQK